MHEIRQSESIAHLAEALAAAQAQMGGAIKGSVNPHFRSRYADLASIWEAIRGPLSAHGLSVLQPVTADGPRVTVTTILLHASGEYLGQALTLTATQDTPQALGSATTYGRRYGLAMVGIAPEDDDGEAASTPTAAPVVATAPTGYQGWMDDLAAVADNGTAALQAAWKVAPESHRTYASAHHAASLASLKARAAKVTP